MEAKDRMIQKVFEFTGRYISDKEAEQLLQEGRKEVVEWTEHNIFHISLDLVKGQPILQLVNNEHKLGERWQAKLKEWGIEQPS